MQLDKSSFFSNNHASLSKEEKIKLIKSLRADARDIRDKNNVLMKEYNEAEFQLSNPKNDHEALQKKMAKIITLLNKKDYQGRFSKFIKEIEALEIDVHGSSEISGHSPYTL